jgi:nucleoside-diphosphate-sugar epimerase
MKPSETSDAWRRARVLVTGARGFIGSHLSKRLSDGGATVFAVSSQSGHEERVGITWMRTDLTDVAAVRAVFERARPDVVFHLAGYVSGAQGLEHVAPAFTRNLASTVQLLTVAAELRTTRVVLTGSMQEPDLGSDLPIPCSPYAASKWAASGYARMFHALYGLPVVIGRPMMVYGPGQWDTTKLLPYITTALLAGITPEVSSGSRELDWVYVDDVVEGLLTIARTSSVSGVAVDLGSGKLTTVREIIERVAALIGGDTVVRFGALQDRPLERSRAAAVAETARLIDWHARTSLEEGLANTVEWYRERCCSPKPA